MGCLVGLICGLCWPRNDEDGGSGLMAVGWALGWLDDCRLQKFGTMVELGWFVANHGFDVLQERMFFGWCGLK